MSFFKENFIAEMLRGPKRWEFLAVWGAVFFVLLSMLSMAGLAPEDPLAASPSGNSVEAAAPEEVLDEVKYPLPERIVIPAIGVDAKIANPSSTDIAALDKALKSAVVRYPGSGTFRDEGNMFLFGHSSYLPVVNNPAYKLFNEIQKLKIGQEIRVESKEAVYTYRVSKVSMVDASEGLVHFGNTGRKLTLSTCNSFGDSEDRFVVEAEYVGKEPKEGGSVTIDKS